jgi:hypothetical protein
MNREKRVLEDGQAKIDETISDAQAQYLREEKELEASFQQDLNEIEAAMAGVGSGCTPSKHLPGYQH